jgi:5-methylcytosine-specific restriction endonuclease McrA
MEYNLNSLPRNCSKEEIIAEIKRVDLIVGKEKLTVKDYDKYSKLSAGSVKKKFGGWGNALVSAGLAHKYSGIVVSQKMKQQSKHLTDDEVMAELKRIAKILGQNYITQENVDNYSSIISATTIVYRFGTWKNGLTKAGLVTCPRFTGKFSDEECFENLLNVWTHYGRQPKYREMNEKPSIISPGTYDNHFGNWSNALQAFVNRMNKENVEDEQNSIIKESDHPLQRVVQKDSVSRVEQRSVSIGLRYKILKRDHFKCVKCGRSPATSHGCRLEIDHIFPYSKGGKTEFNNLQTLCEKCNLGKGDRDFE